MKTPEEIKRGLELCSHEGHGEEIICEHCPYDSNSCAVLICTRRLSADALAYIQQLEAKVPRWISVEERLPEVYNDVLVYQRRGESWCLEMAHIDEYYVWRDMNFDALYWKVTHWMPLPEPPKEDEK